MELEQMKQVWQQYDEKLSHNISLNEKIIKGMIVNRSKTEIGRILTWEYINASVCALLVVVYVAMWGQTPGVTGIFVSYLFSLALIAVTLVYSLYKISYLSRISFAQDPVATTRERIESFRLRMLKARVLEIIMFPPLILSIYVVVNYWVHQQNILDDLSTYAPRIGIALLVGIPAVLLVYRKVYFRNIAQLKESLKEIDGFLQA
jgi:hypothetical protein